MCESEHEMSSPSPDPIHRSTTRQRPLRKGEDCYRALFEGNHTVMLLLDAEDGAIVDANSAAAAFYGWSRNELRRKRISDIHTLPPDDGRNELALDRGEERRSFFRHRLANGKIRDVEVVTGPISLKKRKLLFSIVTDVTERRRREEILTSRLLLSEFAFHHSLEELLQKTVDEAERLTESHIGFFHFVDDAEGRLELQVWSTKTRQGRCAGAVSGLHYDIDQAGVWVDCVHERRPVIHNDYPALAHRKGLPEGHVPVERELVVPVVRGGMIRAALGVGNKPEAYTAEDVETVSLLADLAWDIAERKRSEEALENLLECTRRSEERLSVILRSVTDGLLALDGLGRVSLMNPAAESLLQTSASDGIAKEAREVVRDPELLACCEGLMEGDAETGTVELSMFDTRRQESRIVQARLAKLPPSEGKCQGVIATLFDVTRDREIERLKSEFVTTAAHELRTPLTAILGYAELLDMAEESGGFTQESRREFIRQIIEKGDSLSQIINDFLDLGRIEGGRPLFLDKTPCDLSRIIEGIVDHHRRETKIHAIAMNLNSPGMQVLVDRTRFSQVLENLLTNAIKYSPDGGTILVEGKVHANEIQISVKDEGIGMTPEQAEKIFDKFYRANTSTTAVGGLGLGMCIVKGIVEAHGGRIWVKTAPREGTTVFFTLPSEVSSRSCETPFPP